MCYEFYNVQPKKSNKGLPQKVLQFKISNRTPTPLERLPTQEVAKEKAAAFQSSAGIKRMEMIYRSRFHYSNLYTFSMK